MNYPLVTLYAGAGYGKTRAVRSFLQKYDAHTTWMQLSEKDNMAMHFWENYTHMVSQTSPEIGAKLHDTGFPETDEAFSKYMALRRKLLSASKKIVFVYDDFHLIHNPAILHFFEKAVHSLSSNGIAILLSRTIPEINLIGLMMHNRVFTVSEDSFRFTEGEIAKYFEQLALSVERRDVQEIYECTRGWAFAVNFIGYALRNERKYERKALETMKENIFKLIKTEISRSVSKPLWRYLLRISLIENLSSSLVKTLASDEALISEMEALHTFIHYDSHLGIYRMHNLFLDYIKQYQDELTGEEKRDTYNKAGKWHERNGYQVEALSYYDKAGNYSAVADIVHSFSLHVPNDIAKYALEILDRMPSGIKSDNSLFPAFPAMHLKLLMSLGQYDNAAKLAEQYVKEYEAQPETPERNLALANIYGILAAMKVLMCIRTDKYDFDSLFAKQREYHDRASYAPSPATATPATATPATATPVTATPATATPATATLATTTAADTAFATDYTTAVAANTAFATDYTTAVAANTAIATDYTTTTAAASYATATAAASYANQSYLPCALLVGTNRANAPEEYIEALDRAIAKASSLYADGLQVASELARGELYYYRRDMDAAELYFKQALNKAYASRQHGAVNRALQYLMDISFCRVDIKSANEALQSIEALLDEKEYDIRYEAYDLALSRFHLSLGQPGNIPDWLKAPFSPSKSPIFLEYSANRVKAQYHYQTKQYNSLLVFLNSVFDNACDNQLALFDKVFFKTLAALSLYQLKRQPQAIVALAEAYSLAEPNNIITPFYLYAKDMRTLSAAALKHENSTVPKHWLESINRNASAQAKKQSRMISIYRAENKHDAKINLTMREAEILSSLAQGLSRAEIAASKSISINTVKMAVRIIFEKLGANNVADAVRIAISKKIILP